MDTTILKGPVFNYIISLQVSTVYHSVLKTFHYSCSSDTSSADNCSGKYYDDALSIAFNHEGELFAYFPFDESIRKITGLDSAAYVFISDKTNFLYKNLDNGGMDGMVFDDKDNLFFGDQTKSRIKELTPSGKVITVAGSVPGFLNGPVKSARFGKWVGPIAVGTNGNLYIGDIYNNCIRLVRPGIDVTIFAGTGVEGYRDGPPSYACFDRLSNMCIDSAGNLYVADSFTGKIRKISPAGYVTTLPAVDVPNSEDIAMDKKGNLYVFQSKSEGIVKITPSHDIIPFAGGNGRGYEDGPAASAKFNVGDDMRVSPDGDLYIVDQPNHCIRKVAWE